MEDNKVVKLVATGVLGVLALIFFALTYFTVDQYERAVVTTFGKLSYIAEPGLHFKIPMVNSVHHFRTDIRSIGPVGEAGKPAKGVNTYTIDNQEVDVVFTVFYRLPPENIAFVYQNAQDYRERLYQMTVDRLKAEMGKVNVAHVAEKRGVLRDTIGTVLKHDVKVLGIELTDFQLTDLEYTKSFRTAVEQAAAAKATVETREQEKEQSKRSAERDKIVAEGTANAVREKAKGDADAALVVAQAEAKAIKLKGEATADAMRAQALALAQNPVLVEMKKAEAWDGKLPQQLLSGITPFMQFNAPGK